MQKDIESFSLFLLLVLKKKEKEKERGGRVVGEGKLTYCYDETRLMFDLCCYVLIIRRIASHFACTRQKTKAGNFVIFTVLLKLF